MHFRPSHNLVLKKARDCFPDAAAEAMTILDGYGTQSWHCERDRVQLAILKQCNADLARLRQLTELAGKDYRDALVGAEYPEEFSASSTASPEEMAAIRARDRAQYEAWIESDGP